MKRLMTLAAIVAAISACSGPGHGNSLQVRPARALPGAAQDAPAGDAARPQLTRITGVVTAPSAGSAALALLALTERPVAGAEVLLQDGKGRPVAGRPSARTDADGRFVLADVPNGSTYTVSVLYREGSLPVALSTLVTAVGGDQTANVGLATTMVVHYLRDRRKGDLTGLDARTFEQVVTAIASRLDDETAPDPADTAAMVARVAAIAAQDTTLQASLDQLDPAPAPSDDAAPISAGSGGSDGVDDDDSDSGATPTPAPILEGSVR